VLSVAKGSIGGYNFKKGKVSFFFKINLPTKSQSALLQNVALGV
jgi:hypothetical protein